MKIKCLYGLFAMLTAAMIALAAAGVAEEIEMGCEEPAMPQALSVNLSDGDRKAEEEAGPQASESSGGEEEARPQASESSGGEEEAGPQAPESSGGEGEARPQAPESSGGEGEAGPQASESSGGEGEAGPQASESSGGEGDEAQPQAPDTDAGTGEANPAREAKGSVAIDVRALSLVEGQSWRLNAVTFDKASLRWSSSNAGVASVDGSGLVTARSPGVSTIYVAVGSEKRASCEVTVLPIE